jgi:hypothetical protein
MRLHDFHVDGVTLYLWTATSKGPIVNPSNYVCEYEYIDGTKPKNLEKNLSQCHFVHQKWTDPGANPDFGDERSTVNRLNHGMAMRLDCGAQLSEIGDWSDCTLITLVQVCRCEGLLVTKTSWYR